MSNVKAQNPKEIQSSNDKSLIEKCFGIDLFGIPLTFGF
jgi:hypothetical protein